jgi:hypothetical protein
MDAKTTYDVVRATIACLCYEDTCAGQRIFYQFGRTGIPIYNTNNACLALLGPPNTYSGEERCCGLHFGYGF